MTYQRLNVSPSLLRSSACKRVGMRSRFLRGAMRDPLYPLFPFGSSQQSLHCVLLCQTCSKIHPGGIYKFSHPMGTFLFDTESVASVSSVASVTSVASVEVL